MASFQVSSLWPSLPFLQREQAVRVEVELIPSSLLGGEGCKRKMGKVNVLLKRSYVCTISVIAITAVLTLGITVFSHGVLLDEEDVHIFKGIYSLYGISVIPLLFAIIGGFGVWKEKKWALIVFAVGMILGCLFFIVLEISVPFEYQQMELMVKNKYLSLLPLSNLSKSELLVFDYTQSEFHCCGLTSLEDWENNIPESCQCDIDSSDECVDTHGSMRNDSGLNSSNVKPIRIYTKPCLPVLIQLEMSYVSIFIGITLAKTLLWLLSVGLCIAVLCQLNKKVDTPNVVYSREAKAGSYDLLNDAQEPSLKTE